MLAIHETHIDLLRDNADLTAYLFERDVKWYHAVLSLNGKKAKVCADLIRRINASRAIGVPPLDLYEAIDEALGTSTCGSFYYMPKLPTFDIKAVPTPTAVPVKALAVKVVKKGEQTVRRVEVEPKKELPKFDYGKVERLAHIWQKDAQLARFLGMEQREFIWTILENAEFRAAVEKGRSRGGKL